MYYELQMRRFLSISLMLLFGLGPLAVAMPGNDAPRVPACCRRNGMHHCAMMETFGSQDVAGHEASIQAPSHCPRYPDAMKANLVSHQAITSQTAGLESLLVQAHSPAAGRAAARISQMRTRAVRGPPLPSHL